MIQNYPKSKHNGSSLYVIYPIHFFLIFAHIFTIDQLHYEQNCPSDRNIIMQTKY